MCPLGTVFRSDELLCKMSLFLGLGESLRKKGLQRLGVAESEIFPSVNI